MSEESKAQGVTERLRAHARAEFGEGAAHEHISWGAADLITLQATTIAEQAGEIERLRKLPISVIDTLVESLSEGLMTDAGLTPADRSAMQQQIVALGIAADDVRAAALLSELGERGE